MPRKEKTLVNGVSRSAWIRRQLMKKHDMTLEAMQAAYAKSKFPQDTPITKQQLHSGKSQIKRRYEFEEQGMTWEDFPIAPRTNRANVSAFIRLYLDTFNDPSLCTEEQAVKYLGCDGLTFHGGAFRNVRSKLKKQPAEAEAEDDEEPIQSSTQPRAGKTGKRKYTRRGKKKTGEEHPLVETYEEMEKGIDKLIADAIALKNWKLVNDLKAARRQTAVAIVHYGD